MNINLLAEDNVLQNLADKTLEWLQNEIFTITFLSQLVYVLLVYFFVKYLSAVSTKLFEKNKKIFKKLNLNFKLRLESKTVFSFIYFPLFIWFAVLVLQSIDMPRKILVIFASISSAWGIIRVLSSTIKNQLVSKSISVILWIIAALNIVGILDETINFLRNIKISIGEINISLLNVVNSVFAFVILIWLVGAVSKLLNSSLKKSKDLTPSQKVLIYKISNIALYVFAILFGLNIAGIDLSALAIFSGALGLGIGFGLQKIFSNLISGIILLLDKSVKPGDVIAIGETYGYVNSLGARCISVLTRDGREHLIPNENLITEKVENWSYSDKAIRLRINVGVSYSSDLDLVRELLLKSVEGLDRISYDPAPNCLIMGFGDSSVDHQLRVWINDPEAGIANISSQIYYNIWRLFKENNVEIPFPQRDIHMKTD